MNVKCKAVGSKFKPLFTRALYMDQGQSSGREQYPSVDDDDWCIIQANGERCLATALTYLAANYCILTSRHKSFRSSFLRIVIDVVKVSAPTAEHRHAGLPQIAGPCLEAMNRSPSWGTSNNDTYG